MSQKKTGMIWSCFQTTNEYSMIETIGIFQPQNDRLSSFKIIYGQLLEEQSNAVKSSYFTSYRQRVN